MSIKRNSLLIHGGIDGDDTTGAQEQKNVSGGEGQAFCHAKQIKADHSDPDTDPDTPSNSFPNK